MSIPKTVEQLKDAAYGLFGIPKGGIKVNGQHIFDFAEVTE